MTGLKLAKLPDRTPVKLTVVLLPDLHSRLADYAALYARSYGSEAAIAELIPAMLAAFLESDRAFTRNARKVPGGG